MTLTGVTGGSVDLAAAGGFPTFADGEREGYVFDGWFAADGTAVSASDVPTTFPAGTTAYTAKWHEVGKYVITFVTNGGTAIADITGDANTTLSGTARNFPTTTREGYAAPVWKDADGAVKSRLEASYAEGTYVYTADWSTVGYNASIVFDGNAGLPGGATDSVTIADTGSVKGGVISSTTGATIADTAMPAATRAGYTFGGWYETPECTGGRVWTLPGEMPWNADAVSGSGSSQSSTTTYYAMWTADDAYIAFNSNGGTTVNTISGKTGAKLGDRTLPTTKKTGYNIVGWFDNAGLTGTAATQLDEVFPAGTKTYHAKWAPKVVTLTFNTAGGSFVDGSFGGSWSGQVASATNKTVLPEATRNGYTFAGWYAADGSLLAGAPATFPVTDEPIVAFTAKWVPANQGVVVFDACGGTPVSDYGPGAVGSAVSPTTMPSTTRAGYRFDGWYDNAAYAGTEVTSLAGVRYAEGTTTYYAKWTANESRLVFNTGGGTTVADMVGNTGDPVESTYMPETTRFGYTLEGWYANAAMTERVESLPGTFPAGGATYYAKWAAAEASIVFHTNGGTPTANALTGTTGEPISDRTMPTVSKTGYTFGGWYANAALSGNAVTELPATYPAGTTEYYAKWNAKTVKLSFVSEGVEVKTMAGAFGEPVGNTNMPTVTRVGYTLAGWYADPSLAGQAVVALPATYPSADVTYYAKWTPAAASIVFMNGDVEHARWTGVTAGDTGKTAWPAAPTSTDGSTFVEWVDAEGASAGSVPAKFPAGTTTYHAKWMTSGQVAIKFDARGGKGVESLVGNPGEGLTSTSMPTTTRDGYTLAGWYASAADAEAFEAGEAPANPPVASLGSSFPAASVTYYAAWTAKSYPVVFDLGADSVEGAAEWNDLDLSVTYGEALPELVSGDGTPMAAPRRTGYAFAGWDATSVSESGAETSVPYYRAAVAESGTTWTPAMDGPFTDLSAITEGGSGTERLVLKAVWNVRISGSVPAAIEFTIDPDTRTAEAQSGVLKSYTPAPLKLKQVNVEKASEGFDRLFANADPNQVDLDVRLNMSVQTGGDRLIVSIPNNDTVTLTDQQLMQFVIPAWDGGPEPGRLNVVYSIDLGANVALDRLVTGFTKISDVYYEFSLAE